MRASLLAALFFIVATSVVLADSGIDAFNRGDYEKAYKHLQPHAEAGDPAAQVGMGHLWEEGLSKNTPKDIEKAKLWYTKAAHQGDTEAMLALGSLQWNIGEKDDALNWLSLAAQRGNRNAEKLLKQMGQPVRDIEAALAEYAKAKAAKQARDKADAEAVARAEVMNESGAGGNAGLEVFNIGRFDQALTYWQPAAQAGDIIAQIGMGRLWENGLTKDTPKNVELAKQWFRSAAEQGSTVGMFELGIAQWNSGEREAALQWLSLAAQRGHENARHTLAQMGQPVQDIESALAAQQAQNVQAQANARGSEALNSGAADLGYAIGCLLGGGCSKRNGTSYSYDAPSYRSYSGSSYRSPDTYSGSISCNQTGTTTFCSDGTSYNRIGSTAFGSDGTSYNRVGNTIFGSEGTTYNRIGNTTFGSDGSSYNQIGNTIFGNDGSTCQKVGVSVFCN